MQSNPNAEVGHIDLPFPNVDGQSTQINNLTTSLYRFEFWEMVGGVPANLIGVPIYYKPKGDAAVKPYYYTVDGAGTNPISGTASFSDAAHLSGDYILSRRGIDFLVPGVDFTKTATGWDLISPDLFITGDVWTALVVENINTSNATVITDYNGVNVVNASGNFDATYKGKHNVNAFATNTTGVTTFQAFSLISDCKAKFSMYGSSARYWKLQFATGDSALFNGVAVNQLTLRKGWMVELVFIAGVCYITEFRGDINKVGVPFSSTYIEPNCLLCDGTEYNIADYQDLIDRLPMEMRVTYAQYDAQQSDASGDVTTQYYINHGKFGVDTPSGKFKVPSLGGQSLRYLKGGTDSTMLSTGAGGMWPQKILKHRHRLATTGTTSNTADPGASVKRSNNNVDPYTFGITKDYIEQTGSDEQSVKSTAFYPIVHY